MSMPLIPEELHRPTKHEVIIDLLKSIAMEETALAHLINAEAEKIQFFLGRGDHVPRCPTPKEIITLTSQVLEMMDVIVMKEWLLWRKLKDVAALAPRRHGGGPCDLTEE